MTASQNKRTIIVGIFLLLGLIFLVAGILAIGNLKKSFTQKIAVIAVFDDVSGLQQGNNIWFSGVKIGTVKDLSFTDNSKVTVEMNIDEKAQPYIHKNAKAKISSEGLIGNRIIILFGGSPDAPVIEDGDVLQVEHSLSTEDMMKTFQENNVNILKITSDLQTISDKIMKGEGTLGKLLNDEALYVSLEQTAASLKQASVNANQLTAQLEQYSMMLNREGSLAHDLVNDTMVFANLRTAVSKLTETADNANTLVKNLKEASTDPQSPVGVLLNDAESAASLKAALKNLESGSQKLNENLEAMKHSFLLRGYFKKKEKEKE